MLDAARRRWMGAPPLWLCAVGLMLLLGVAAVPVSMAQKPLPAWNDTDSRRALIDFVEATTTEGSEQFVPVAERIAVFDNDGTLWGEQPLYFQLVYAIERVRALAASHPEWQTTEPFASVLQGDMAAALSDKRQLMQILMATHAGMNTAEFARQVEAWLRSARHPESGRLYTQMVYEPMLELLQYLRQNGYQTWIVSGGGIEFIRVFAERVYGIPPEQVVGSSIATRYDVGEEGPQLLRDATLDFIDDGPGKPVGIQRHIGRRPILAVGNSDGDFQMLEWTTAGDGPRLGVLVHHDDAAREVAYDRDSHIGRLQRGLDEGPERGWLIVSMQKDWKTLYPPQ